VSVLSDAKELPPALLEKLHDSTHEGHGVSTTPTLNDMGWCIRHHLLPDASVPEGSLILLAAAACCSCCGWTAAGSAAPTYRLDMVWSNVN